MKFNPQVIEDNIFEPPQVMSQWWGGSCNFEYDHDKYWPALVKMCEERRNEQRKRWTEMGAKVGLREWDFKDGDRLLVANSTGTSSEEGKSGEPAAAGS